MAWAWERSGARGTRYAGIYRDPDGHKRSIAAAGVPSPAQYGRHLNSDHGCGTIMRASSCTELIRTWASCRRTSAPNRVT